MKRVLFLVVPSIRHDEIINMDSNSTWIKPHMPIGVLSIISYTLSKLNDDDDECVFKVVDLREYYYAADGDDDAIYNTQRNLELILDFDPDYIMLSALFNTCYFHIKYILDTIAKFKKKYLIFIGGGYATLYYKNILQEFELIDGVVIAEGEIAVADILANKISMWKKVSEKHSSIFTRDKLTKFIEPIPEFVNNLDEIPELDLTYINQRIYSDKHIAYSSSRGCPFNCIFCAAGVMAGKK